MAVSFYETKRKHEMRLSYAQIWKLSPHQLDELYKNSNPRERRFITVYRKSRVEKYTPTAAFMRASYINRLRGIVQFAIKGLSGTPNIGNSRDWRDSPVDSLAFAQATKVVTDQVMGLQKALAELHSIQRTASHIHQRNLKDKSNGTRQ